MNKVAQITSQGVISQGANKGKPFIRVIVNGKGVTIPNVSETVAKLATAKGYCFIRTLGLKDIYPTTNNNSAYVYAEGHAKAGLPIYTKGEKLTVEEYWARRNESNVPAEPRELTSFAGFPTDEECKLLASARVAQMQFA